MAKSYLPVDRDQLFMLPPDMREWLPEDHLVWFLLEVLERVDTSVLHARRRRGGVGRRGYDPEMLLALLIYAYCTGQRSSRQIERLCEVDVAYRVICAGQVPDHTTIARFRQDHQEHAARLFTDVLMICAAAGLASVGVVAVDGTKMGCDAGLKANRTRTAITAEVAAMLTEAEQVDADQDRLFGDARGDELPEPLRDRRSRRARLDAALAVLNDEDAVMGDRDRAQAWVNAAWAAAAEGKGMAGAAPHGVDPVEVAQIQLERIRQKAARRRAAIEARAAAAGRKPTGAAPGKGPRVAGAEARLRQAQAQATHDAAEGKPEQPDGPRKPATANVTDPQSRVMKTANGWVQGYNAQAAVNEHGVVVAADVTQDHNDAQQLEPMISAVRQALAAAGINQGIGTMLFDAGYWSEANATAAGPDRLIATTKDWKRRKQLRDAGTVTGPPPDDATPKEAMEHRLCTTEGAQLYARRGCTIEPVFGDAKHNRGYRRFIRRGLDAATAEWLLIHATGNLLKVFRHQPPALRA